MVLTTVYVKTVWKRLILHSYALCSCKYKCWVFSGKAQSVLLSCLVVANTGEAFHLELLTPEHTLLQEERSCKELRTTWQRCYSPTQYEMFPPSLTHDQLFSIISDGVWIANAISWGDVSHSKRSYSRLASKSEWSHSSKRNMESCSYSVVTEDAETVANSDTVICPPLILGKVLTCLQ